MPQASRTRTDVGISCTDDSIVLLGGGLQCSLSRKTGQITHLVDLPTGLAFVDASTGPAGIEIFDERDRKWYTDLHTSSDLLNVIVSDREAHFVKAFRDAPFLLRCTWRVGRDGIRMFVEAFLKNAALHRSVRVSMVLPALQGMLTWVPSYPAPANALQNPTQYCYLADEPGKARTGIPMLTLYIPDAAGLTLVMPFETPKVQLNMGVEPRDPTSRYVPERVPKINAGAEVDTITPPQKHELGERPVLRFTEKHVGIRPGRTLPFGIWLFSHEPDCRGALGRVVETYREYFEPHPAFRSIFGPRQTVKPDTVADQHIRFLKEHRVTHCWFHGHFEYHGEFLTDEALRDAHYRWACEPYPDMYNNLSVEKIRGAICRLKAAGIGTFLYGFNMHCDPAIIEKRNLYDDVALNADGQVARAYHQQPVMFFAPDSPFGTQLLNQMDRLVQTYPEIIGVGLDNWNYAGIDFGHDDGITMVNNRAAASINFSQQHMIPAISRKMHGSGRFVMTNKGRTIESMKGVDAVGTESRGAETYAIFAYMNLLRCVTPTEYAAAGNPDYAECVLKYLLVWGGQPGTHERAADPRQMKAYQPLFDALRNRRWVFDPDPLTLPEGYEGQIFRIDSHSPWNPDAVVVTLADPSTKLTDRGQKTGLAVVVRLPDADRLNRAVLLRPENNGRPEECEVIRRNGSLEVAISQMGCAAAVVLFQKPVAGTV